MAASGILIINKPSGFTSHDVVNKVRKIFNIKRVGHAGTLDPIATGVLVVMVGKKATKLSSKLTGQDKEYIFEMEFGRKTDTGDIEGKIIEEMSYQTTRLSARRVKLSRKEVKQIIPKFLGEIEQTVPLFSAVKVKGKKLYELARKQSTIDIKLPKRIIKIHELELLKFAAGTDNSYPTAKFRVVCSKGTYTRVLVEDIGKALGLPTYQKSLVRTRSGNFTLDQAISLDKVCEDDIIPV